MAERIAPSESTLVKYDNPVLVTKHEKRPSKSQVKQQQQQQQQQQLPQWQRQQQQQRRRRRSGTPSTSASASASASASGLSLPALPQPRGARAPQKSASAGGPAASASAAPLPAGAQDIPGLLRQGDAHRETDEILNAILPPREWEEDGQLWRQSVSNTPATRLDVINLQEQLDMRLQQRQARETGICPVRRQLYTQCFDELIRQVTINCAERGLLLLRVRDEIRMTIAAYQTLYESSIAFGMRKALMSEQGKADLETTVGTLVKQKSEFERQVVELRAKAEQIERRAKELQQAEEKKHAEEIDFFKRTNQQLKSQLEGIIAPKK